MISTMSYDKQCHYLQAQMKNLLRNAALFNLSLIICFALAEVAFRLVLFSDISLFDNLRHPRYYADYFSDDDHWKLYYKFGGKCKPPKHPHPLLGWVGDFNRENYKHNQSDNIKNRRPVLLYGDSFAACVSQGECFQDILI